MERAVKELYLNYHGIATALFWGNKLHVGKLAGWSSKV